MKQSELWSGTCFNVLMLSWIGLGKPTTVSVSLQDMHKNRLAVMHSKYKTIKIILHEFRFLVWSWIWNLLAKCVTDKFTSAWFQKVFNVLFSVRANRHPVIFEVSHKFCIQEKGIITSEFLKLILGWEVPDFWSPRQAFGEGHPLCRGVRNRGRHYLVPLKRKCFCF